MLKVEEDDYKTISVLTPGNERVPVVFDVLRDELSKHVEVTPCGKELRNVMKAMLQE